MRALVAAPIGALCHCSLLFGLDGLDKAPPTDTGLPNDGTTSDGPSHPDSGDAPGPSSDAAAADADGAVFASPDAQDSGGDANATDASDAPVDAVNDGPGADVVCAPISGDGGGMLLASFSTSDVFGWTASSNGGAQNAVLGWTASDGNACPGALTLTAAFQAYNGDPVKAEFTYGSPGSAWNGTRLHAWIKILPRGDAGAPDYQALGAVELYVMSGPSGSSFSFVSVAANPTYSDGGWHDIVLDLSSNSSEPGRMGPDVVTSSIARYGVSIAPGIAQPPGEPATPPPVLLLIDDIWVE